ncbi:MAG: AtpZ/AtpI family protein [Candidatus Uhrbacteria bacterium]
MDEQHQRSPVWAALAFAWELGYTIAIPLVVFALLGRFLDRRFGTTPWFLLVGVFAAIAASGIAVVHKVNSIAKASFQADRPQADELKK